jgi:tetratricopeptide (TPR) repeat protein
MNLSNRYLIALLVVIVLGIYYPTIFAPFNTVDDVKMVTGLLNKESLRLREVFFPGGQGYYYRPLLYLSFWLDTFLWGQEASFWHLVNILIHAANAVLVFFVTHAVSKKKDISSNVVPSLAALLFAVHPINTEAVNWVSGRSDLLACLFLLLSILSLFLALETGRHRYRFGALTAFLTACLCKDSAIFFLPGALAIIFCYDEDRWGSVRDFLAALRKRSGLYAYMLFVPILYFSIRHLAFAKGDGGVHAVSKAVVGQHADYSYIVRAGLKSAGFYASKLFYPFPLNFGIVKVPDYFLYIGILVFIVCFYLLYRRDTIAALFLASVSIASSALVVVYGRMAWTPIAERYLYIPSATFSVAIVLLVYSLLRRPRRQKQALFAAFILFAVFGYATVARNIVWQDNLTLFQDTVKKSPDFPPAKNELAIALLEHGRKDDAFRIFKSNKTADDLKNNEYSVDNRALTMAADGDLEGARSLLLKSLDERSRNYNLLVKRLIEIDTKRASDTKNPQKIKEIRTELVFLLEKMHGRTGDPFYLYRIGQNYMIMKDKQQARNYFKKAYEAAPDGAYYKEPARKLAETLH